MYIGFITATNGKMQGELEMNKYKEAKINIVNTLVRIVGYPTLKKQFERDLEVLGELVEKATPKKVQYSYFNHQLANYHCINCGEAQGLKVNKRWRKFCPHCGQALDWSKEDDC